MKNLYTKAEIRRFRNNTQITPLILDVLKIPFKTSNGYSRFRCPICEKFDLVTIPDKNLALCTYCETDSNPIDIVMKHNNMTFKQAADFLHDLKMV